MRTTGAQFLLFWPELATPQRL